MTVEERFFEGLRVNLIDSIQPDSAVLDYGSGSGMVSVYLLAKGYRVTAMDISPECEKHITAKCDADMLSRFDFVQVDPLADPAEHDPLRTRRFGLVVCREVLEHVANPWKLLALFCRHLDFGGMAVVSIPAAAMESWLERRDPDWLRKSGHCRIIDPDVFRSKAAENGLTVRHQYGTGAEWSLLWAMLAPFQFPHKMGNPIGKLAPLASWLARRCVGLRRFPFLQNVLNGKIPKSVVFELERVGDVAPSMRARRIRPTVLLVYDYRDWILHQWVTQIRETWQHKFDFVSMSMFHAAKDRQLKRRLVAASDVVHLLLPHATEVFCDCLDERFIGTVHHWVDYATVVSTVTSMARLVTGANEWRDHLVENGVKQSRITVIHSGAPKEFFADGRRNVVVCSRVRVGFSAKFDSNENDRKGTRHFARLVKHCVTSGYGERIEFVLTGPGWEAMVAELRSTGATVEYRSEVPQPEMPDIFRGLDIYLMLSDVEGGPATIAEAMAAGCVVISTRIGLARDCVQDGVTGFFVENSDTAGQFAILKILMDHHDRLRAIGNAAAVFADAKLRYTYTLGPLGDLYREIADTAAGLRSEILDGDELARQDERNRASAPSAWPNDRIRW